MMTADVLRVPGEEKVRQNIWDKLIWDGNV
jgi:hypothetical protein